MEIIIYLLIKLGILFGNPTPTQNPQNSIKKEQTQPMQMKSSTTGGTETAPLDGGSGTWGDNG